ncbi:TIGR01244 family sulfur transferase [Novosphingobium sp.]|uniref:TIGR01244 family sulfur transferase n=1 Tax=Novosphingobium sp. TaxID=1874826 RepID=UPI003BAC677F
MFRKIDDKTYASPQIEVADITEAAALGVGLIINNRPEDESPDQTPGAEIQAAATGAGIAYVAIPVTHAGFSMPQVEAMQAALAEAGDKPVLAYCRSGTRSTLLWALAQARMGMAPADIASHAAGAGYDVSPILPQLDFLAAQAR